jgi:hypothetical protein
MFAVSEVAPGGAQNGQSQTQQSVIASVVALQRVIAGQSNADSGDATSRGFAGEKQAFSLSAKRQTAKPDVDAKPMADKQDESAQARSIVEAQEASQTDHTITKAFQARHGLTDLLSVIRDPEDRMLPTSPES